MQMIPRSVSAKIYALLCSRLARINATGDYQTTVGSRLMQRTAVARDFEPEEGKAEMLFVFRADEERTAIIAGEGDSNIMVVWIVLAVVRKSDTCGSYVEAMISDIERAMEVRKDLHLRDPDTGRNLLVEPLTMASASVQLPEDAMDWEAVAFTVETTFPHRYGEPDHVFE